MERKIIYILMSLLLIIGSIGGATYFNSEFSNEPKHMIKIGVSVYKGNDTFVSSITKELEKIIKCAVQQKNTMIKLDVSDAKESQMTQMEQIQKYIDLNYDVICVNIVDRTSAAYLIDQATSAQIPIIFFNRQPVEEDMHRSDGVYYIGSNAKESAIMQGELIIEAYKNDPYSIDKNQDGIIQYAMLEGEAGHQDAIIRTEYVIKTLEKEGIQLKKVGGWGANFDRNQASALVEQALMQDENMIELIIANNDDMALGAADASQKLQENIVIVGIDGTPQGKEAVDQGILLGTVVSEQKLYAREIFTLCMALMQGKKYVQELLLTKDQYIWIPWEKYT